LRVTNIENDAKAMAYGEWKYGAGHSLPNVICVTLGTGIGGGLILRAAISGRDQGGYFWPEF
jgi:glucokinase